MTRILNFFSRHKIAVAAIAVLLAVGGYYGYKALKGGTNEVRYVLASVERGTLIAAISGSGQVAASDKVDIKSKVSGDVIYYGVKIDQEVKTGALIAQLDTKNAEKSVESARTNLANAESKLKDLEADKIKKEEALDAAYEDTLNVLAGAFQELAPMMPELKKMFRESSYGGNESDIDFYLRVARAYNKDADQLSYWTGDTERKYLAAQTAFDAARTKYWALNQNSPYGQIETALNQTCDMAKTLLDLTRQSYNLLQKYRALVETHSLIPPIPAAVSDSHFSKLNEYNSSVVSRVNALSTAKSSIADKKEVISDADSDIEAQYDVIEQYGDALSDARENLALHSVRAPFDGVIVKADVKKGDSVTSATALATIITRQKIAEITLNEIDAAKVKTGQKATVAFDAIDGLSAAGEVIEVDALGTVSQGVVTYGVKIAFDAGDERVKPGMSVSVAIIAEAKTDVLLVSNSAVKSSAGTNYVEMLAPEDYSGQSSTASTGVTSKNPPSRRQIQIGSANDLFTEVAGGLEEGDMVVVRTINSSSGTQSQSQGQNLFQIPGAGRVR